MNTYIETIDEIQKIEEVIPKDSNSFSEIVRTVLFKIL